MTTEGPPENTATKSPPTVVAAGGVVLDDARTPLHVLVVHRPTHDDWSLPKGHVDPGESLDEAAVREVSEETGVRADITGDAGTTEHTVTLTHADGATETTKRVHWFTMRPTQGAEDPSERAADGEVDRAEWWDVARALMELTYAGERGLLARVLDVQLTDGGH